MVAVAMAAPAIWIIEAAEWKAPQEPMCRQAGPSSEPYWDCEFSWHVWTPYQGNFINGYLSTRWASWRVAMPAWVWWGRAMWTVVKSVLAAGSVGVAMFVIICLATRVPRWWRTLKQRAGVE